MPSNKKRIGFLPRPNTFEVINNLATKENLSASKVVGILVEEALIARGLLNKETFQTKKSSNITSDIYKRGDLDFNQVLVNDINELVSDNGVTYEKTASKRNQDSLEISQKDNLKKVDLIDNELIEKFRLFQEFQDMARKGLI